jgi:hypothetical protein
MKWMLPAGIGLLIVIMFSIPILHEAGIDGRTLKVARIISKDIMESRRSSLKNSESCGVSFDINNNNYTLYCSEKPLRTVSLSSIASDVVFSSLLDVTQSSFNSNKVFFGKDGKRADIDETKNSIYLLNKKDETLGIKNRAVRIYVDVSGRIDILKVDKVYKNGDLVFEPL